VTRAWKLFLAIDVQEVLNTRNTEASTKILLRSTTRLSRMLLSQTMRAKMTDTATMMTTTMLNFGALDSVITNTNRLISDQVTLPRNHRTTRTAPSDVILNGPYLSEASRIYMFSTIRNPTPPPPNPGQITSSTSIRHCRYQSDASPVFRTFAEPRYCPMAGDMIRTWKLGSV
jgi:hypothetical protein